MANEYVSPVLELIKTTPHDSSAVRQVIEMTEVQIKKIDEDIADLISQRSWLNSIFSQYAALHKTLYGEKVRSDDEIKHMARAEWSEPGDEDIYRGAILETAKRVIDGDGTVSVEKVLETIENEGGNPPWANPNAVAATILIRSGDWEKVSTGKFIQIARKTRPVVVRRRSPAYE